MKFLLGQHTVVYPYITHRRTRAPGGDMSNRGGPVWNPGFPRQTRNGSRRARWPRSCSQRSAEEGWVQPPMGRSVRICGQIYDSPTSGHKVFPHVQNALTPSQDAPKSCIITVSAVTLESHHLNRVRVLMRLAGCASLNMALLRGKIHKLNGQVNFAAPPACDA